MARDIVVLKIDPARKHIAKVKVRRSVMNLRRLVQSTEINHEIALELENAKVVAIFASDKQETGPGYRFSGHSKPYRGVSLISGFDKVARRVCDTPVDIEWLKLRIRWEL